MTNISIMTHLYLSMEIVHTEFLVHYYKIYKRFNMLWQMPCTTYSGIKTGGIIKCIDKFWTILLKRIAFPLFRMFTIAELSVYHGDCCQKRGHSANFFVEELNASLDDDAFPLNANIERKQGLHAEHKRQVSL